MKKITALVLALVMTLSLLPMNVWAAGESGSGQPLYWSEQENVWVNSDKIIDKGMVQYFDIATDAQGTYATWTDLPQIVANSDFGDFTLSYETGRSRIKWDATNAKQSEGNITLNLSGINYQLPVRVNVCRMGLDEKGGDCSTVIDLDQAAYEWKLYAHQYVDGAIVYTPVTADKFATPTNCPNLSWKDSADDNDSVGDTLVFSTEGLDEKDFPMEVYVTSKDQPVKNYYFEIRLEALEEEVRQLYINVGNDTNRDYRTEFQAYKNDTEPYGLWFFVDGENDNKVEVNGGYRASASEGIGRLYFVEGRGFLWDFSGATAESGFLEMRNDAVPGVVYRMPVTVNEGSGGGNQGGDGRIYYEYTTSRGNSILVVSVMPEQLEVINLPERGRLENDTLTVTLKTADPALWLPLLYNDDGLLVHFEVFPAINGERIECEPKIAEYAASLPLEDQNGEKGLISLLVRDLTEGHDAFFKGYNAPTARLNGLYYAWSSEENDGDITIIPNNDELNYAWVWNYKGVEARPDVGEDWLPDGYCLRFVMSDEISGAITLKANPPVEAQRIKLVQHTAKESAKDTVEALFHFKENRLGTFTYEEDGVLTYLYDGDDKTFDGSTEEIKKAVDNTEGAWIYDDELPGYNVLEITAPKNCVPKALVGSYVGMTYDINNAPPTIVLPYRWLGLGTEHIYALTWYNTVTRQDYTEQLVIKTPSVDGAEKWMDRFGRRIPSDRVQYTDLPDDCGASISYEDGFILTTFDNDVIIDANTILDAQVFISVPEVKIVGAEETVKPVELRILPLGYDGTDDPTLNYRTEGLVEAFGMDIDNKSVTKVSDIPVAADGQQKISIYLDPLKKQAIGDIEYYYSADRMTHFALMRWDFADGSRLYEYMEIETTNYFCQWEEELKADSEVTDAVEVPTAVNDSLANSDIKLISRMHPQKQEKGYGQYFFELQMVDEGEGNVYTDTEGTTYFTIILPYSFMGEDWNYEKAKNLKEKPMITHFDKEYKKLAGNKGTITGEYTERGIEFEVNSFSPFTVSWTEETVDTTPSYPGSYYPIVTPETTPVEKHTETKPTETTKPTTPPAEVTVPVSGDEHTINVEVSVSGTTATIDKVDMTKLEGVIGDDVAVGTVTIDFSVLDKAIDTVEIPADVVKEIAAAVNDPNNDAKSLEVVLNEGMSIEFDAKALANKAAQADGLDITISMKHAEDSAINDHQKSAIGDRVAFDINVTSGGEHITDMGGEVIVHAPYVLRDGEEAAGIVVCYVDDAGNKEKCETNYDSVKQRVNWKTTHFSVYMIDYDATLVDDGAADAPPVVDDAPQSEATNDIGLWIGVALVVLVIAIVIVAVAIKRKK